MKVLAKNKSAFRDYQVLDKYEAGIKLLGSEVKSAKTSQISLKEAYIHISKDLQAYLVGAHIAPYQKGNKFKPTRDRKLLLNKKELLELSSKLGQSNLTVLPLKVYLKNSFIKLEIGLAKHKKRKDRREKLIKKALENDIKKELK
jgi:SsrA-binding protein